MPERGGSVVGWIVSVGKGDGSGVDVGGSSDVAVGGTVGEIVAVLVGIGALVDEIVPKLTAAEVGEGTAATGSAVKVMGISTGVGVGLVTVGSGVGDGKSTTTVGSSSSCLRRQAEARKMIVITVTTSHRVIGVNVPSCLESSHTEVVPDYFTRVGIGV